MTELTEGLINKTIRVIFIDGEVLSGKCEGYTQALDNEPEVASIDIRVDDILTEIMENEIESVEILK